MFGLTPSGLARRAGLNATSFNKSKRYGSDGRPRWPSTESIAKVLDATGLGVPAFLVLVGGAALTDGGRNGAVSPLALPDGFADDGAGPFADAAPGFALPLHLDAPLLAVEVKDGSALPLYRPGDRLIASRAAKAEKGDRIILSMLDGRMLIRALMIRTRRTLTVSALADEQACEVLRLVDVAWTARILWASQ
ncbi:MAG: helix-turn-helix transcriptional regulator [Ancalomicrobiaceae bacterium]|nr:helix-turn-helix transcriptional regulator [Ancalomicrobiaceae bacterium]